MSERDRHLWGEDGPAVRAGVDALRGQHPERGGTEREHAAFMVVLAVKPIVTAKLAAALEQAAGQYGPITDEQRNEWLALVQAVR